MRKITPALCAFAVSCALAFAQTQEGADEKFAAQDWDGASQDYQSLLASDDANAQNWLNLARALHQLEDYEGAREAYLKAIDNGVPRAPLARYHLARVLMTMGREEEALAQLEEIAKTGGPPGAFVQNTAEFASLVENKRFLAVVLALTPCQTEKYRQFDFWLGEWDVTAAGNAQATASSKISSIQNECAILEEYTAGGFTGISISFYDIATERWHQTWISNSGGSVYLEGHLNDAGEMALTDKGMTINEVTGNIGRTTWTPNSDGSVRQLWEQSTDQGETWNVVFDGTYTRKEKDDASED